MFWLIIFSLVEHHGRVQIKVYRGPTTHEGHDHFAPWGYWVKQPEDEGHH